MKGRQREKGGRKGGGGMRERVEDEGKEVKEEAEEGTEAFNFLTDLAGCPLCRLLGLEEKREGRRDERRKLEGGAEIVFPPLTPRPLYLAFLPAFSSSPSSLYLFFL